MFSPVIEEVGAEPLQEVFSHPILNAINRLLSHYLLGNTVGRVADLHAFVSEALVERNVRADFVRILYQPMTLSSPYHMISLASANALAELFHTFYTYVMRKGKIMDRVCVQQRDYKNAFALHKTAALFIVQAESAQYPLYNLLCKSKIYAKVGWWKELLVDFCQNAMENDPVYVSAYEHAENTDCEKQRINAIVKGREENGILEYDYE